MRTAAALAASLVAILPTSTFPKGSISTHATHEIPRLDTIVTALAGHAARVNCWTQKDWSALMHRIVRTGGSDIARAEAFTEPQRHVVQVSPAACETLAKILAQKHVRELEEASVVELIAHESQHVAGVMSEARAECRGMAAVPRAARLFGLSAAVGARLQHVYRGTLYPLNEPGYRLPGCRSGLPGVVVSNVFGPDADVASLEGVVRRVALTLHGWQRLPIPPRPLSKCSVLKTRSSEAARVEHLFRRDLHTYVFVYAIDFRNAGARDRVFAHVLPGMPCRAAAFQRNLRKYDGAARVSASRLPSLGPATTSYRLLAHSRVFFMDKQYVDTTWIRGPGRRLYGLEFQSDWVPVPSAVERPPSAASSANSSQPSASHPVWGPCCRRNANVRGRGLRSRSTASCPSSSGRTCARISRSARAARRSSAGFVK